MRFPDGNRVVPRFDIVPFPQGRARFRVSCRAMHGDLWQRRNLSAWNRRDPPWVLSEILMTGVLRADANVAKSRSLTPDGRSTVRTNS